jgi:GH15 family glucan-1,4-alpha-glucosidase
LAYVPYPSVGHHAVIGDRRTAALVAADGTLDWLCLPNYDGAPWFGALLDIHQGGYWRLGPAVLSLGEQPYLGSTPAAVTTWATSAGEIELTDSMPWPREERCAGEAHRRVVLRRLRCMRGEVPCAMRLCPRPDYQAGARARITEHRWLFTDGQHSLGFWSTFPTAGLEDGVGADFHLRAGDEHWAVLALDELPATWSRDTALQALHEAETYWREWHRRWHAEGARAQRMIRAGTAIHLLSFAPDGSLVAAPTKSLPERIGGTRNYDYRYAWVRDASLSIFCLVKLGDQDSATRYLDWMARRTSSTQMPLQVAYRVNGKTKMPQIERPELLGYRGSRPVPVGNRAFAQEQPGALGYLAGCALEHLIEGGVWNEEHWRLIARLAGDITSHWHEDDNGIWELSARAHYVSSKVMSWVVLDRALALAIAERTGRRDVPDQWRETRQRMHTHVMEHGWSDRRQSFVQRYGAEALDASTLLIPVMGFLPADHPRERATIERATIERATIERATIERATEELTIDGLVYRFEPDVAPIENPDHLPMGEFEGAFLPCTFWLATTHALAGHLDAAEATLRRAECLTNACGLFAEEADPRTGQLLSNYPLLFSQVEYLRAAHTVECARQGQPRRAANAAGRGA